MSGTCEVSLGGYDGDSPDFFHPSFVGHARKARRCHECQGTIGIGEPYERVVGKWDDEVKTYVFCMPCSEIGREFFDDGRTFGVLWDGMQQNWSEGAHLQACLNRLTTAKAKAHMRDMWLRWKGLL